MPAVPPLLRRLLPFLSVALLAAVVYDGWIFYSRWSNARESENAGRAAEQQRARDDIAAFGGTDFRIINFYGSPTSIHSGARAQLCYGVYGAKTVRLEPPVESLAPAVNHCLVVAPRNSTEYKLIAEDGAGHTASASVTITVAH